jgi:hypothetical protein
MVMGLFRKKPEPYEAERCPQCREPLPGEAERCEMCGADLRYLRAAPTDGEKPARARDAA